MYRCRRFIAVLLSLAVIASVCVFTAAADNTNQFIIKFNVDYSADDGATWNPSTYSIAENWHLGATVTYQYRIKSIELTNLNPNIANNSLSNYYLFIPIALYNGRFLNTPTLTPESGINAKSVFSGIQVSDNSFEYNDYILHGYFSRGIWLQVENDRSSYKFNFSEPLVMKSYSNNSTNNGYWVWEVPYIYQYTNYEEYLMVFINNFVAFSDDFWDITNPAILQTEEFISDFVYQYITLTYGHLNYTTWGQPELSSGASRFSFNVALNLKNIFRSVYEPIRKVYSYKKTTFDENGFGHVTEFVNRNFYEAILGYLESSNIVENHQIEIENQVLANGGESAYGDYKGAVEDSGWGILKFVYKFFDFRTLWNKQSTNDSVQTAYEMWYSQENWDYIRGNVYTRGTQSIDYFSANYQEICNIIYGGDN